MIYVAILGFGVVGSGVAEVLTTNQESIDRRVRDEDRKSTRLNSSHRSQSRMPSSA